MLILVDFFTVKLKAFKPLILSGKSDIIMMMLPSWLLSQPFGFSIYLDQSRMTGV